MEEEYNLPMTKEMESEAIEMCNLASAIGIEEQKEIYSLKTELDKTNVLLNKTVEEKDKTIEEKDKTIEELTKKNEEQNQKHEKREQELLKIIADLQAQK